MCRQITIIFGYDRYDGMGPKITRAKNDTIDYMLEKDMIVIMDGKCISREA